MGGTCRTSDESCETGAGTGSGACSSSGGRCPCGSKACSGDPTECAASMWACSFFQAMKELQVELLKAKIQKAWGTKMDKAADAVLEAMGVQWQSMLAQAKAKAQFRERLAGLWQEGQR